MTYKDKIEAFNSLIQRVANNDPELTELELSSYGLEDEDVIKLAEALEKNNVIYRIDVSKNSIGPEGAIALAANKTITDLWIDENNIGDDGAIALAENKTLIHLTASNNGIGRAGAEAFAKNKTLEALSLSSNYIGEGVFALAKNNTLRSLLISDNSLEDAAAEAFAENGSLIYICMADNLITDVGAKALAKNRVLTRFDMTGNRIGCEGAEAFAENPVIEYLNVSKNKIETKGALALARSNILRLDISYNQKIEFANFAAALAENKVMIGLHFSEIPGFAALAGNSASTGTKEKQDAVKSHIANNIDNFNNIKNKVANYAFGKLKENVSARFSLRLKEEAQLKEAILNDGAAILNDEEAKLFLTSWSKEILYEIIKEKIDSKELRIGEGSFELESKKPNTLPNLQTIAFKVFAKTSLLVDVKNKIEHDAVKSATAQNLTSNSVKMIIG